ncbi:MAG: 16S rRNA (guanine(527)-N(7))-methyltransferase RsmG [Phototrophicaceae bacterium]|jgi:16S rRNA (guanine527-N7)-methyltransferase
MAFDLVHDAKTLLNLDLTAAQVEQFALYQAELLEWNAHTNLTAITAPQEVQIRHFLDSLTVILAVAPLDGARWLDLGSGAGFPGLPLAIVFPQLRMTLVDSTGKKVTFVQHIIDRLGLSQARAVHARAEEIGQDPAHRGKYDVVMARAVARLPALLEYMLPLAKINGRCVAMKGISAHDEAASAKRALNMLGGKIEAIHPVQLPEQETPHYLVTVKKVAHTPSVYPRRAGIPTRQPIEP